MRSVTPLKGEERFERADSINSEGIRQAESVASSEDNSDYFGRFTTAPAQLGGGAQRRGRHGGGLDHVKEKHAKCMEVLRKKALAPAPVPAQADDRGRAPPQVLQESEERERSAAGLAAATATARVEEGAQDVRHAAVGQALKESKEAVERKDRSVAGATELLQACCGGIEQISSLLVRQHQEQLQEMEQLRRTVALQAQCDALRLELEEHRRREAEHERVAGEWQRERAHLQGEVLRLTELSALQGKAQGGAGLQTNGGAGIPRADSTLAVLTANTISRTNSGVRSAANHLGTHAQARPRATLAATGIAIAAMCWALTLAHRPKPAQPSAHGPLKGFHLPFVAGRPASNARRR